MTCSRGENFFFEKRADEIFTPSSSMEVFEEENYYRHCRHSKKGIFIIVAFSFIEGVASPNVAFGEADAFGNAKASGQTKDTEHDRL